jgi:hypothetical protein
LDAKEKSWVEEALASDPALRAKNDQLRRMLEPLDGWQVSPTPAILADKVLSHVRRATGEWDTARPWPMSAPRAEKTGRSWPFFRARELVAVAACLLLLMSVLVPGVSEMRSRSRQTVCANNLGSIFRGVSLYQEQFDGNLPYAGHVAGAAWLPQGRGERPYVSNSRHPYLLAKHGMIARMSDFLCPAAADRQEMDGKLLASRDDFSDVSSLTYDTLNLSTAEPNLAPPKSIAYVSDRNPLFVNGRFDDRVDPDHTNSPAHGGRGQTVLTLDGTVRFVDSPIYGEAKDNLWLVNDVRRYTGTEAPRQRNDAFLVPGFPQATSN